MNKEKPRPRQNQRVSESSRPNLPQADLSGWRILLDFDGLFKGGTHTATLPARMIMI